MDKKKPKKGNVMHLFIPQSYAVSHLPLKPSKLFFLANKWFFSSATWRQ